MNGFAVIITDSEELKIAVSKYIETLLKLQTYHFTYGNSDLISQEIYSGASIFILELFRVYPSFRIRAEGIFVAEKLINSDKKILIFAPEIKCHEINSPIYWDISCEKTLKEKIKEVLKSKYNLKSELEKLKNVFKDYILPPSHHHH